MSHTLVSEQPRPPRAESGSPEHFGGDVPTIDDLEKFENQLHSSARPRAQPPVRPQYHGQTSILGGKSSRIGLTQSQTRRTVELKSKAFLHRLLTPLRGTVEELEIQRLAEFDQDGEKSYRQFMAYLREVTEDFADSKNDPFCEFQGRRFIYTKVCRVQNGSHINQQYICIKGFKNESEVRRAHAQLSRTRFRKQYCPPLHICYDLRLEVLAARPHAYVKRYPPKHTLCGLLVEIGGAETHRVVTIGGLLRSGTSGTLWAVTSSHLPNDEDESADLSIAYDEIPQEEYDNVPPLVPPVIILSDSSRKEHTRIRDDSYSSLELSPLTSLGEVSLSGDEWAVIRLDDQSLPLPNGFSVDNQTLYVSDIAPNPDDKSVVALGGISGPINMCLKHHVVPLRLPSGAWADTWTAEIVDSVPTKGDSGAWVVDPQTGTVYGHIIATDGDDVFILPFKDILSQLRSQSPYDDIILPDAFECLADSAQAYWKMGNVKTAKMFAREAAGLHFLQRSSPSHHARALSDPWENSIADIIMRTGPDLSLAFDQEPSEAQDGQDQPTLGHVGVEPQLWQEQDLDAFERPGSFLQDKQAAEDTSVKPLRAGDKLIDEPNTRAIHTSIGKGAKDRLDEYHEWLVSSIPKKNETRLGEKPEVTSKLHAAMARQMIEIQGEKPFYAGYSLAEEGATRAMEGSSHKDTLDVLDEYHQWLISSAPRKSTGEDLLSFEKIAPSLEAENQFACPFYKRSPIHFRNCKGNGFNSIGDLEQHLRRQHQYCPQCPKCGKLSPDGRQASTIDFAADWDILQEHHRSQECKPGTTTNLDGLNQMQTATCRECARGSDVHQWTHLYQSIFPDVATGHLPSPFVGEVPPQFEIENFITHETYTTSKQQLESKGYTGEPLQHMLGAMRDVYQKLLQDFPADASVW
ncbi:putative ADP-ribosylation factor [Seiridium cardinale]